MQKYCLALDLKDNPDLIEEYKAWHRNVWAEIKDSIREAGISNLEIYCIYNRLFMIIEADDEFSFERKADMDAQNSKVQEWEELMWNYQQQLPGAKKREKWMLMEKIFGLKEIEVMG